MAQLLREAIAQEREAHARGHRGQQAAVVVVVGLDLLEDEDEHAERLEEPLVAELVGATGGVGYELLKQQQLFDMAGAMAWTLQLVLFVLIVQQSITALESWMLRYRAVSERAM